MERIVIEVDDNLAKQWRKSSELKRKSFENKINLVLAKELFESNSEEYIYFLHKVRIEMAEKGLSQEELDSILNDE